MTIVIIQSRVTKHWGYCPSGAVDLLKPHLDDKPTGYTTSAEALAAAKRDRTVPKGSRFEVRS